MQMQSILTNSPYYPKEWLSLPDAPQTLWYVGDISLLQTKKFTIVGSRRTPVTALKTAGEIAKALSAVYTIVSGAADGGDTAAVEGALSAKGKVICVLAGGMSAMPQSNYRMMQNIMQNGLLLSPYPPDTPTRTFSYEYRNKLLAALGEGTLVVGAAEKSGALITAKYAKQFEKPIFALPYTVGSACGTGCNALIKTGAYLTETAEDVAQKMGISLQEKAQKISLTADEEKMLAALKDSAEEHITALSQKSGVPVFKARAVLSSLEVKGLVVALGGNRYAPV
jgi:DNA processing protein